MEYEGLNLLCFSCGKFGHTKEKCEAHRPATEVLKQSTPVEKGEYGPWLQVPVMTRGRNLGIKNGGTRKTAPNSNGSQFGVLEE